MGNGVDYHHISKNLTIKALDNFHGDSLLDPALLPLVNSTNCTSGEATCSMVVISATTNAYDTVSEKVDTGATPVAATAMSARMVSRQAIQIAAGNVTADFHDLDEGNRCAEINNASLQWALAHTSAAGLARYQKLGNKLIIGDDLAPANETLWSWSPLNFTSNADKTETTLRAPNMRTPANATDDGGLHYCKLLSPFRALEWIYSDSLYDHDSLTPKLSSSVNIQHLEKPVPPLLAQYTDVFELHN